MARDPRITWRPRSCERGYAGMGQGGGAVYAPPASEAITHDADGNLTGDGRWTYTWDSENRLIAMETKPALVSAGAPRQSLEFGYDAGHRRVSKAVQSFSSSLNAWSVASQTLYLYDGWNLIAEFDTSTSLPVSLSPRLLRSYEWGLDLSGTMTGAGGVGGLLIIRSHSTANNSQPLQTTSTSSHAPCYDGNGNIAALVNLATGQTEARYDYGPFGERVLAAGGAIAEANPFRFSTKYEDAETGLLYYGYRFYDPAAGRWINRDPIGERGGVNLFGMSDNSCSNTVDSLGLIAINRTNDPPDWQAIVNAYTNATLPPNRIAETKWPGSKIGSFDFEPKCQDKRWIVTGDATYNKPKVTIDESKYTGSRMRRPLWIEKRKNHESWHIIGGTNRMDRLIEKASQIEVPDFADKQEATDWADEHDRKFDHEVVMHSMGEATHANGAEGTDTGDPFHFPNDPHTPPFSGGNNSPLTSPEPHPGGA